MPLVLAGQTDAREDRMEWSPAGGLVNWLEEQVARAARIDLDRLLVRLTVQGNFVWDARDADRFLDGDSFGRRPRDQPSAPTLLRLPGSGDGVRGGDFRLWFWLSARRQEPPRRPLQVTRIAFLNQPPTGARPVPSALGDIGPPGSRPAVIQLPAAELNNRILITFNRPIDLRDGIGPAGRPQIAMLERSTDLRGGRRVLVRTDLEAVERDTVMMILREPAELRLQGPHILTIGGTEGRDLRAVRAEDGGLLDGDYDDQEGGNFTLDFIVT
jgi:hypothetical protein